MACEFTSGQGEGGKWHDRRKCGYDRNAVKSVKAGAGIRAILQHAPCVDWTVDIDSHLALQNAYILHAAQQCFAKQCKPKKKAWISDRSMEFVRQTRSAVRMWTELYRRRWSFAENFGGVESCARWQNPHIHHANAPSTDDCHAKHE